MVNSTVFALMASGVVNCVLTRQLGNLIAFIN